jgi:hypothetical protein
MTVALEGGLVRVKGEPIGYASGLAIRLIFLREIDWAPPNRRLQGFERIEDREMELHELQRITETDENAKALCAPIQSFYRDVTLTEESARRLPIVAVCAAPKRGEIRENIENICPALKVQIPGVIWSEWEGEYVDTQLVEGGRPDNPEPNTQYLPPLELTCNFADSMAIFAAGHVAYSISILMRPDSFPRQQAHDNPGIPVYPSVILSLLDIARFTGRTHSQRPDIRFGFVGDRSGLKAIDDFVFHRILSLAGSRTVVTANPSDELTDIFRGLIWPIRKSNKWHNPKSEDDFARFRYEDLQSATCEVVEFSEFDRLQAVLRDAKDYRATSDAFTRGLAGLAQNVIDFEDQDDHEVNDSLISAGAAGGYSHFVNAKAIVRFYRRSRSFERMQHFIGGDPYFLFTVLAAVYNEYLAGRASKALSELKPGLLIEASAFESTRGELESRYRIFAAYLRPMIPNLFRYQTESQLFDNILERRGVSAGRETIEKELSRYETIAHDFESLNLQRSNMRINMLVTILALWSAFGALVTAASLFVSMHTDTSLKELSQLAIHFAEDSVGQFMEVSLWAAVAGLVITAAFSLVFLFYVLASTLRRSFRPARRTPRPERTAEG